MQKDPSILPRESNSQNSHSLPPSLSLSLSLSNEASEEACIVSCVLPASSESFFLILGEK